jgi:hypothetical protein
MEAKQVKKLLKDGYEQNGFDVVSEQPNGETILRYPHPTTYDVALTISDDDIAEYTELLQVKSQLSTVQGIGLANIKFREQLLHPLDTGIDEDDLQDFVYKDEQVSETYVEIGEASLVYANYFRFDPDYIQLCLDRLFTLPEKYRRASANEALDIRHIFRRPLAIRVFEIQARNSAEAVRISDELIDSTLFTLAYDYDLPLMLAEKFPPSRFERLVAFQENDHRLKRLITPEASFRRDLVRLYQAGLASPIASHQFLSYYQIMELFFQDVNYGTVYEALDNLLHDESFRINESYLNRLVQIVEAHKQDTTTADLLEQLLRQHINSAEIKRQIEASAGNAEETLYTLARRLVAIRDAIVTVGANNLPVNESSVAKEIALMKFLAERVILATREG